jgi:hypothetical protein
MFCQTDSFLSLNDDWSEEITLRLSGDFEQQDNKCFLFKHLMNNYELQSLDQDNYLGTLIFKSIENKELQVYRDSFVELNNDPEFLGLFGLRAGGQFSTTSGIGAYSVYEWEIKFNLSYDKNGNFTVKNSNITAYLEKIDDNGNHIRKYPLLYFPMHTNKYDINSNDILFVKHFRSWSKNYFCVDQSIPKNQKLVENISKKLSESENRNFCLDISCDESYRLNKAFTLDSTDIDKYNIIAYAKKDINEETGKVDNLQFSFNLVWDNKTHQLYFELSHVGLGIINTTNNNYIYSRPLFFQKIK